MIEFSSEDPHEMTPEEQELFYSASKRIDPSQRILHEIGYYFNTRQIDEEPNWDDDQEVRDHLLLLDGEYEAAMRELREEYEAATLHIARFLVAEKNVDEARRRADRRILGMLLAKSRIARHAVLTIEDIQKEAEQQ